eukprot:4152089-Karenia_brevis.AAC.1
MSKDLFDGSTRRNLNVTANPVCTCCREEQVCWGECYDCRAAVDKPRAEVCQCCQFNDFLI